MQCKIAITVVIKGGRMFLSMAMNTVKSIIGRLMETYLAFARKKLVTIAVQ